MESTLPMPDTLTSSCPNLHTQFDSGILYVSLNAPELGNSLSWAMLTALDELLQRIALDESVRVVVLRGTGNDFSRGLDLQDFSRVLSEDVPRARTALDSLHQWRSRKLRQLPQPVMAWVQGACHGAAVRLIEGCDIVLAADDAEFIYTAADAPLLARHPACVPGPDWMAADTLSRWNDNGHALSAPEAARVGLITQVCSRDDLATEVQALAQSFLEKDRLALQFTKETVAHVSTMSWDAAVNYTAAKFAELKSLQAGSSSARASGISSFLAGKSKPGLKG